MTRFVVKAAVLIGAMCLPLTARADEATADWSLLYGPPVKVEVKDASSDEHLLQIARAADVNVFADATPKNDTPKATVQTNYNVMGTFSHFADTHPMRFLFAGGRNFLLWREPQADEVALARQVLAQNVAERVPVPAELAEPEARTRRLTEYFTQEHGWNGDWKTADISVRLSDLPLELRLLVLNQIQSQAFGYSGERFNDELWHDARLVVANGGDLRVAVKYPSGAATWGVGPLSRGGR